ncbi:phosphoribosyltransferase [Cytobacillus oceanisediminis]|uniref:phosphoribosyltransferase n=1 Tax=Cytobacillus oceanisediminis TaxID=665099 RepID=UPI001C2495B4|nr:phosphoribosyltransferase [Cytobacillus oceanisediminis]MBU8768769.1 phosphoribosyltransferase [Cytobacillus oceanisediminis]
MSKTIVLPTATLKNEAGDLYEGIKDLLNTLHNDGDKIIIMSHDRSKIADIKEEFDFVEIFYRREVREMMKTDDTGNFILVGSNEDDLRITASTKSALLVPEWSDTQEIDVKYGVRVPTPKALIKILQIIKNQKEWFYELDIDENAKLYSLTSANSKGDVTKSEREIVDGFRATLKNGRKKYFKVLQLHFLASLIHNPIFKEVDIWSIMPSSGTGINEDMWALKERARLLMGKRLTDPLFIRHTIITKSHYIQNQKDRLYCDRHFKSLNINPQYKKKIKGKVICILDDYLTNGTSFETLRNLLMAAGAKKVIFVSLGRFRRSSGIEYFKQDYNLSGDVYGTNYTYELIKESDIKGQYNSAAREEIKSLYDIIYK